MTGEELKSLRKQAGMKSYELAKTIGYSPQRWTAFERGYAPIPKVVEFATRWVCENHISNDNPSLSAAERAVNALIEAMENRRANA